MGKYVKVPVEWRESHTQYDKMVMHIGNIERGYVFRMPWMSRYTDLILGGDYPTREAAMQAVEAHYGVVTEEAGDE